LFHVREYVRAESLEQAYELNKKKSSLLIGGMMWLRMSTRTKATVIDLSGLGLDTIEEDEEEFRIGCMCTLRQLETHSGLNQYFNNAFNECTRHIVGTQFRNTATVGGSVFGRFGYSDILTCMMMLDTYVELYHGGIVPLEAFAKQKLDRDILVRVIIKKDGRQAAYITQRNAQTDFPVIACAVAKKENLWYISVGARPDRAALTIQPVEDTPLEQQAEHAAAQFNYGTNMRATGEYRAHLAKVYIRRLMEEIEKEGR
jgi:CO/xanthine dehydrogenase FAD-binding subunit